MKKNIEFFILFVLFNSIIYPQLVSVTISANDGVSNSKELIFGIAPTATIGIDPAFSESELPPLPPKDIFDIRFELIDTIFTSLIDIRPISELNEKKTTYKLLYQLGSGSKGLTLSWNLPEQMTLSIKDELGGTIINESFGSNNGSLTISDTSINVLDLDVYYGQITALERSNDDLQQKFELFQNYPNPFNPNTTIQFLLPTKNEVSLVVYDIFGKEVTELLSKKKLEAGEYKLKWNAEKYSSGVYYYQINSNNYTKTRRMILLK